jgi:hypothetical protein
VKGSRFMINIAHPRSSTGFLWELASRQVGLLNPPKVPLATRGVKGFECTCLKSKGEAMSGLRQYGRPKPFSRAAEYSAAVGARGGKVGYQRRTIEAAFNLLRVAASRSS